MLYPSGQEEHEGRFIQIFRVMLSDVLFKKKSADTDMHLHTYMRKKSRRQYFQPLGCISVTYQHRVFWVGSSHLTSQVTETSSNRGVFLHHQGVKKGCSQHLTSLLLGQSVAHKAHHAPEVPVSLLGKEPCSDTDVCAVPLTKTSVQVPASAAFP